MKTKRRNNGRSGKGLGLKNEIYKRSILQLMEYSNKYFTQYLKELKRVEIDYVLNEYNTVAKLTYNGFDNLNMFTAFLTDIQQNLELEVQNNLFHLKKEERIEYLKRLDFQIRQLQKRLSSIQDLFDDDVDKWAYDQYHDQYVEVGAPELSEFKYYYDHKDYNIFSYLNININMPVKSIPLLTTIKDLKKFNDTQWKFYELFGASHLVDIMANEGLVCEEGGISISEPLEDKDLLPEFDYKTEAQKIAWLYELGILDIVINKCKNGETINCRRAGFVIHSFTGIDAETLRKCLSAIYQPGNDQKNNPLVNADNKLFVAEMAAKFKLNKQNKQQ